MCTRCTAVRGPFFGVIATVTHEGGCSGWLPDDPLHPPWGKVAVRFLEGNPHGSHTPRSCTTLTRVSHKNHSLPVLKPSLPRVSHKAHTLRVLKTSSGLATPPLQPLLAWFETLVRPSGSMPASWHDKPPYEGGKPYCLELHLSLCPPTPQDMKQQLFLILNTT